MSIDIPGGPQVDMTKTRPIVCSECGNYTFTSAVFLREVSAIMSPNGKQGVVPVPTMTCNACGRVPDILVPSFLKNEAQVEEIKTSETKSTLVKESLTGDEKPVIKKGNLTLLPD